MTLQYRTNPTILQVITTPYPRSGCRYNTNLWNLSAEAYPIASPVKTTITTYLIIPVLYTYDPNPNMHLANILVLNPACKLIPITSWLLEVHHRNLRNIRKLVLSNFYSL